MEYTDMERNFVAFVRNMTVGLAALLVISCGVAAQDGWALYDKYSGMDGVEAVCVPPFMSGVIGSLLGVLPGLDVSAESMGQLDSIFSSLGTIYALDVSDKAVARRLAADVAKAAENRDSRLLLESRSDGNTTCIYATSCKDGYSGGLSIWATDPGSVSLVYIECSISLDTLRDLLSAVPFV